MRLIDTHCHLDLPIFDADRAAVVARARAAGIVGFVLVASSPATWEQSLDLAESIPGMLVALGVHPNDAGIWDAATERRLYRLASHPLVRAIGEIGLDYHWKTVPPAIQERVFRRQLEIARELELPIVLHQREAVSDLLRVLETADPPHHGVMHCFTGDTAVAQALVALGLSLGIGGILTFPSARTLRDAVRTVPSDRLLLETDAPYLAPVPFRGRRNEPAYLRATLAALAALRECPERELAECTTRNAVRLFRFSDLPTVLTDERNGYAVTTGIDQYEGAVE